MCGIFGARKFNQFEVLYDRNKDRGSFSHGFLFTKKDGSMFIRKGEGKFDPEGERVWGHDQEYDMFLGHTQAPTSINREFQPTTTHPFECGHFLVAHNGVLENHYQLAEEYNFPEADITVDSCIIPRLLEYMYVGDDIRAIKETCEKLKGIFSCWIYSKHTSQAYVVRSGSTLYTDDDRNVFTSIQSNSAKIEISEGRIICFTEEGLTEVGEFKSNNPFFMI